MVVDDDKNGDEYNPEVSGVEHPEEFSENEYAPMKEEELRAAPAQQGSSPAQKLFTAIILIVAVFAVATYLMHKKKVQLAEQSQSVAVVSNTDVKNPEKASPPKSTESVASVENPKADLAKSEPMKKETVAENTAQSKPEVTSQPTASSVVAQNQDKESAVKSEKAETAAPMNDKQLEEDAAKMAMTTTAPTPTSAKTDSSTNETTATSAVAASETATVTTPVMSSDVDKQITALKDQAKNNESKLNDLNTRVSNLDGAITKLNNSIMALDKKIGSTVVMPKAEKMPVAEAQVMKGTQAHYHKHRMHIVAKNRMMNAQVINQLNAPTAQLESNSKIAYVIRAMVPGRAWIESPNGYKFSVSVGDRVLGYGTITQINSDDGEVTFDGGDVIKYGPDDH